MISLREYDNLKDTFKEKYDEKISATRNLRQYKTELEENSLLYENSLKARAVIQEIAQETQKELEFHISNLVTLALDIVFPDENIHFVTRFVQRRNKTECDLLFEENGNEYKPLDGSGYGAVDVAAFALRLALWTLDPSSEVMILDEPFRDVSPDLQSKVGEMLKTLSDRIGIQIIMVSHAEDVNIQADKTFVIKKSKDQCYVEGQKKSKPKLKLRKK
ncbi:MAG: hypothetical protein SVK08_01370 [Halobacteriota archaeon]|nr:hypothetical protein [Halobacteriota archaeon]